MVYLTYVEDVLSKNPVIIVGSGTSCGAGISGMYGLSQYILENVNINEFNVIELEQWRSFAEKIQNDIGLEEALQSLGDVSSKITDSIVNVTWECISNDEQIPLISILNGEDLIGLVRFFNKYYSSNIDCLNIITTNYDHLVEASAAVAGWEVWDGFGHGILSEPMEASRFRKRMMEFVRQTRKGPEFKSNKFIKIYKPHGSLSWFKKSDGSLVKVPSLSLGSSDLIRKSSLNPAIITPGIGKYLETHYEPYTNVMGEMKNSIRATKALMFLGFGFNDIHIQASFESALKEVSIPKLIITRSLSDSFFQLVKSSAIRNFVAIEQKEENSRVFSDQFDNEYIHENVETWTLKGLLNIAWGCNRAHYFRQLLSLYSG